MICGIRCILGGEGLFSPNKGSLQNKNTHSCLGWGISQITSPGECLIRPRCFFLPLARRIGQKKSCSVGNTSPRANILKYHSPSIFNSYFILQACQREFSCFLVGDGKKSNSSYFPKSFACEVFFFSRLGFEVRDELWDQVYFGGWGFIFTQQRKPSE